MGQPGPATETRGAGYYEGRDGLSQVTENSADALLNVVFVHGLGGSGYSTWFSDPPSPLGFWPEAFGKAHPRCCIWTVHYTARILDWLFARSPTMGLLDRAAWLLDQLVQRELTSKPIVFVSHSLGGIVVKQALQFSCSFGPPGWRLVWDQTRAVFFLATPHVGSGLSGIGTKLANAARTSFLYRPSGVLKNLEKNNPPLRFLTDWYKDKAPVCGIETRAFAERRRYRGVTVVDEVSASPQVAGCVARPVPDDHISIAKPADTHHEVYADLSKYVRDLEKLLIAADKRGSRRRPTPGGPTQEDVADLVAGSWWERITRTGDPTAISFCQIGFNVAANQVSIGGDGYGGTGKPSATWHSRLGSIEKNDRGELALRYFWKGEILVDDGPRKNPEYNGFGEITFTLPADPSAMVTYGSGFYWNVDESQPERTSYKRVELKRIVDRGLATEMRDGKPSERHARAAAALDNWDQL